ncbi:MAG: DUF4428 domain-containing protein [Erysipelotrichaceae bacterium]|nr:DUF4428 domain-containing protein [Erysipelotrichaceae bacterium]
MDHELEYTEEVCSLCGERLTEFGNKKLKDGILCRNCVKKASSWLEDKDYESRTVEDIHKHLQYRKANLEKLDGFTTDKKVEGKYSLYIDEHASQFIFSKRKDLKKENADVIPFSAIREISVMEADYLDEDSADLYFEMLLDHEEIPVIRFRVNEFPGLDKQSEEFRKTDELAMAYLDTLAEEENISVKEAVDEQEVQDE